MPFFPHKQKTAKTIFFSFLGRWLIAKMDWRAETETPAPCDYRNNSSSTTAVPPPVVLPPALPLLKRFPRSPFDCCCGCFFLSFPSRDVPLRGDLDVRPTHGLRIGIVAGTVSPSACCSTGGVLLSLGWFRLSREGAHVTVRHVTVG